VERLELPSSSNPIKWGLPSSPRAEEDVFTVRPESIEGHKGVPYGFLK
jgi:hypothetical protein